MPSFRIESQLSQWWSARCSKCTSLNAQSPMRPDHRPTHDVAAGKGFPANHQRAFVNPPEEFASLTTFNTTLPQVVVAGGGMNLARTHSRKTTDDNDSHGPGANNGQPSGSIFVHWSCPTHAKPKPSRSVVTAAEASNGPTPHSIVAITAPHGPVQPRPHWDQECRKLWLDGVLVKKFRQRAANQELILAAFQEEGWPSFIDDPLPPEGDQDPKRRLHSTLRNLNRGHKNMLIHFEGDGTGERIGWKWRSDIQT